MNRTLYSLWLVLIALATACTTVIGEKPPASGPALPGQNVVSNATTMEWGLGVQIHSGMAVDRNVVQLSSAPQGSTIPITGTITLGNHNDAPQGFRLTALLNYQQTPSTINTHTDILHTTVVNAFTDEMIEFTLQLPNQEGRYKLWWVVFGFPDEHPLDMQSRLSSSQVYSFATDIVVGNGASFPVPTFEPFTPYASSATFESFSGIQLTHDALSPQASWFTDTVKANDTLPYFIHIGNSTRPVTNYALVAFLNGLQIPIQHDEPAMTVFWGTVDADSLTTIPASVQVPEGAGIHELQVLYVPDPYGVEGTEAVQTSIPRWVSWGTSMSESLRVGLIVAE